MRVPLETRAKQYETARYDATELGAVSACYCAPQARKFEQFMQHKMNQKTAIVQTGDQRRAAVLGQKTTIRASRL